MKTHTEKEVHMHIDLIVLDRVVTEKNQIR